MLYNTHSHIVWPRPLQSHEPEPVPGPPGLPEPLCAAAGVRALHRRLPGQAGTRPDLHPGPDRPPLPERAGAALRGHRPRRGFV